MAQSIFYQLVLLFLQLDFAHHANYGLSVVEEGKSGEVIRMTPGCHIQEALEDDDKVSIQKGETFRCIL
jgi:hypothetical protein